MNFKFIIIQFHLKYHIIHLFQLILFRIPLILLLFLKKLVAILKYISINHILHTTENVLKYMNLIYLL